MIVDVRRYTLKPGQLGPYLARYGAAGYAAQTRHLGEALGWFVADVGPQNHVLHLWGYTDAADMEARRGALAADADWIDVRNDFKGLFAAQETEVMTAIPGLPYTRSAKAPGLVDIRIYTLHHGELAAFLDVLATRSAPVQARHWTDNIAYLVSRTGRQNRIMHLWGYADHAERLTRRQALLADPDWQDCMKTFLPMMADMQTFTAVPAPFWTRPGGEG